MSVRAPSIAAAIWLQKDMRSPSGGKAHHRGGTQIGKAPPSPEMTISGLTRGRLVGENDVAKQSYSPALPDVRPAPQAGCFVSRLYVSCESQITLRHRAFRTVAIAPSSIMPLDIQQSCPGLLLVTLAAIPNWCSRLE